MSEVSTAIRRRIEIIERLGRKCSRCGFNDYRALQIDHINGGGNRQRKEDGQSRIMREIELMSDKTLRENYQLLCANCNWIKRDENNELKRSPRWK